MVGENSSKVSVWKKAMLAGREDTNILVVHLDWSLKSSANELEDQNKQPTSDESTLNK